MTETRKLKVFLCHASQDKPVVREIYLRLLAEGWIDPWLDKEKLLPGQEWEMEIEKSVETADVVIVCLSKSSVEKEGYYQKEIKKILDVADEKPEGTIFIIPLRLDDCRVPRRLVKWQYEDYFPEQNKSDSYKRVLESLKSRGNALDLHYSLDKELMIGGVPFMFIRSGKFLTGDGQSSEVANLYGLPTSELLIPYDYWIARDPITTEQYVMYASEQSFGSYLSKGNNDHPATGITWENAMKFVDWFSKTYGDSLPNNYIFDLPSSEEWEKAARGLDGRIYPWGNKFDERKCNTRISNIGETTPIGKYSPDGDSPYGARDMAGNVWEWTRSSFGNKSNSTSKIMCGGSFGDDPIYARCAFRMEYSIATSAASFGFRLAIVPKGKAIRDEVYFPTL